MKRLSRVGQSRLAAKIFRPRCELLTSALIYTPHMSIFAYRSRRSTLATYSGCVRRSVPRSA